MISLPLSECKLKRNIFVMEISCLEGVAGEGENSKQADLGIVAARSCTQVRELCMLSNGGQVLLLGPMMQE